MLVKVEFNNNMLVVEAKNITRAVHYATKEFGEYQGPYVGQKATELDIIWFKAMGGEIQKVSNEKQKEMVRDSRMDND